MPTIKKRINISLPEKIEEILDLLAKRDQMPIATKATNLIERAIELEEDEVLNKIAENRDNKNSKFLTHEEVWN